MLEPDGEPRPAGDLAHRQQHAGHERRPVEGVVPDGQGLPRAAEQHLLVGDQAAQPHRVHRDPVDVARRGRRPARGRGVRQRAAARPRGARRRPARAVRRAVPLGASALSGWCSSTISTDSKNRAACAAKRIISTAPMREVRRDEHADARARRPASRAPSRGAPSSKPVVPTTAWMPCSTQNRRLSITDVGVGEVDRDLGAGVDQRRPAGRPGSSAATSSRSSAASTARHASAPIRPAAPSTPTLIIALASVPTSARVGPSASVRPRAAKSRSSSNGPTTASVGARRRARRRRRAARRRG